MKKAKDCIQPSSRYKITLNPVQGREIKSYLKKKYKVKNPYTHHGF
jgi:hypothetical protein